MERSRVEERTEHKERTVRYLLHQDSHEVLS
jgi:hypothetical protein